MSKTDDTDPITLLIIDDHPVLRDGIAALIAAEPDMLLLGQASTADEGVALFLSLGPDVTVLDIELPNADGVKAIERIRHAQPDARILVLTTYPEDAQALLALRAGAAGYLIKSGLRRELIDAIRAAGSGQRTRAPRVDLK